MVPIAPATANFVKSRRRMTNLPIDRLASLERLKCKQWANSIAEQLFAGSLHVKTAFAHLCRLYARQTISGQSPSMAIRNVKTTV